MSAAVVPLHPERAGADGRDLRWVLPGAGLSFTGPAFTGRVATAPGDLGLLLREGVLADLTVTPGAVVTRLAEGRTWAAEGPRVRTALHAALRTPEDWNPAEATAGVTGDDLLRAAATELLGGPLGQSIRSHGGSMELVAVRDGVVEVRVDGACDGCPALGLTLHARFEHQLRRRCPHLARVRTVRGRTVTGRAASDPVTAAPR